MSAALFRNTNQSTVRLLDDQSVRIGVNGVDEIKSHPFFNGTDWENIRSQKAPFVPVIRSATDTSNFEEYEIEEDEEEEVVPPANGDDPFNRYRQTDIRFIGYTYKSFDAVRAQFATWKGPRPSTFSPVKS